MPLLINMNLYFLEIIWSIWQYSLSSELFRYVKKFWNLWLILPHFPNPVLSCISWLLIYFPPFLFLLFVLFYFWGWKDLFWLTVWGCSLSWWRILDGRDMKQCVLLLSHLGSKKRECWCSAFWIPLVLLKYTLLRLVGTTLRCIKSGTVNLEDCLWLVMSWILEETLLLFSWTSIIPNRILNTHPHTKR